jgi:tight adherence protein C
MNFPVLNFFTVAPLLYFGIWLIAQESLLGSERLANYMKGLTNPGRVKDSTRTRNLEHLTLVTTALLLVLLGILAIALNYAKTPLFMLITICTLAAWLQKKKLKDKQDAWQERLDSELPGLIQMLTLMVASGISPLRAIELIALDTNSELSYELIQILERVRQGDSSSQALEVFARRVNTLDARRFSNAISMALERGSPLIPVLSALVGDARNEEKVRLLRRVGKAEIALMVPVVFLLLPISVLFALFPSFVGLQMF